MSSRARPIAAVPGLVQLLVVLGLCAQLLWHSQLPPPTAHAEALPLPPTVAVVAAAGLGDRVLLAKLLMLWLQAFDNQPGVSIPWQQLDYERLAAWLGLILDLDPHAEYPLLAATRIYGEVPNPARQRIMLEFVREEFLRDPDRRWPWLAHAVYLAKHRLHDERLALDYAQTLAEHATGAEVPHWAQQMRIFVLADMGEVEAAKVLLGGLLASGEITDPHEREFLSQRLQDLGAQQAGAVAK